MNAAAFVAVGAALAWFATRPAAGALAPWAEPDGEADQLPTWIDTMTLSLDPSTYETGTLPGDLAHANVAAFLRTIQWAEGTARAADPYRVVMGYGATLRDLSDHPYFTGEWSGAAFNYVKDGETLVGWSTAAGAYQIIRKTWAPLKLKLALPDFSPASQDAAAVELIAQRGALADVRAGRFADALAKCRPTWASLPGAGYGQRERRAADLAGVFTSAGGTITA